MQEEDGLVLSVEGVDVADSVELLVGPRVLVDLHAPSVVVGDTDDGHDAGLNDRAHDLPVDRERRCNVANEHAPVEELLEIGAPECVHLVAVRVDRGIEIDLRSRDAQERVAVTVGPGARLGGVDDVVRRRDDPELEAGRWAQGAEGADVDHGGSSGPRGGTCRPPRTNLARVDF